MSDENIQLSSSHSGDHPTLQEYPLQSNLLQLIPAQAQKGLSTFDIEFTCIDTDGHYIAIGSNIGIVYLFDRRKNQLFRFRNDYKDAITCVKVLISLDCLVVFGCKNGAVFVFKVPLSGEEEFEKFTVDGLHSTSITALEWAKNGIKFFSGDESGVVVCTEIDHFEHRSRSRVLLNEPSKIIQLSYDRMCLLVSTLLRSVICSCEDNSITRIGQKERKCFGPFGAIIFHSNFQDGIVYASRPGQRLWKSDKLGSIHETIIFKTALCEAHPIIPLQGAIPKPCDFSDFQFGKLLAFSDKCILISSDFAFILIDPEQKSVISSSPKLFPVVDVTTSNEEIFVLKGIRQLIRISSYPDPYASDKIPEEPSLIEDILVPFKEFGTYMKERTDTFSAHAESSTIFDWLRKKRSASSPAVLPANDSEENQVESSNSESLPELVKLDTGDCTPVSMDSSLISVDSIPVLKITTVGENESDDIVYKPKKKKNRKVRFRSVSPKGRKSLNSEAERKNYDETGSTNIVSNANKESGDKERDSITSEALVPNLVETNAETKSDLIITGTDSVDTDISSVDNAVLSNDLSKEINSESHLVDSNSNAIEESTNSFNARNSLEQDANMNPSDSRLNEEKTTTDNQLEKNDTDLEFDPDDIYLSFDPSKNTAIDVQPTTHSDSVDHCDSVDHSNEDSSSTSSETMQVGPPKYGVDWVEYRAPDIVLDLCISNDHIFCVDIRNQLYFSNYPVLGLQWRDLSQPAEKIAASPTESVVWALYRGTVFAAVQKSSQRWFDTEWISIARDIISMSVEDDCGWYVTSSGQLFVQPSLTYSKPYGYPLSISCDYAISQVACRNGVVWILTVSGALHSLDSRHSTKYKFIPVRLNNVSDIDSVFLGVQQTGWVIDSSGIMRFLIGVTSSSPGGVGKAWEVEASKYVMEQASHLQKALKVLHNDTLTSLIRGKQHICLSSSPSGVWFCKTLDNLIYSNQKNIIGHMWDPFVPLGSANSTKWSLISAASVTDSQGSLWCINSTSELFCVCTSTKTPVTIELPSVHSICCFAPSTNALWILTESGEIFSRRGITSSCPEGVRWQRLDLVQLCEVQISFISCSSDVSWACASDGNVFMRLGSLCPSSTRSLPQAWIPISSGSEEVVSPILDKLSAIGKKFPLPLVHPRTSVLFHKIYVGPLGYPVWAIDNRSNVYVREGVSPNLPVGKKWTYVPELHAKELGISRNAVWLLKNSGKIYRRFNVSEKNPCGDYWKQIPGIMDHLSVTPDDDLWGLKDDRIFLHSSFVLSFSGNDTVKSLPVRSISEDDWEDIMADVDDEL